MILQGSNYIKQTIGYMVSFLEETVENWEPTYQEEAKQPRSGKKRKAVHFSAENSGTSNEEETSKKRTFCQLHGMYSHTTDQCKGLKGLTQKKNKNMTTKRHPLSPTTCKR